MKAKTKKTGKILGVAVVVIASLITIGSATASAIDKAHLKCDLEYTSNANGTHTAVCLDEDCEKEFTEKCTFEQGKCIHCDAVEVE